MADIDVKKGPNGYNVTFPEGGSAVVLPTVDNFTQIRRLNIRYPNGTEVSVAQGVDQQGRLDPNKGAGIRIEGAGVTPDLAARHATAILGSDNFMKSLVDTGRIIEGPDTAPVGTAKANAAGFAAQINPTDAVIVPKRAPAAAPR